MADNRLLAYYDLRCAPLSFDFAVYLSVLVGHAVKHGHNKISLCIFAPFYRKSNSIETGYPEGYEDRKVRNVLYALIGLVPMIDDIIFTKSGVIPRAPNSFPLGYDPGDPALAKGSPLSLAPCTPRAVEKEYAGSGNPRIYRATGPGLAWVRTRFPGEGPLITLSPRTTTHNSARNCSLENFYRVYRDLQAAVPGCRIVVIPDQDDLLNAYDASKFDWRLSPEAAIDLELRMALYASAALNLSWNGGLTSLLMFSDSNYLIYGIWNETSPQSSKAIFDRKGPSFGEQLPWALPDRQILDWTHGPSVTAELMTSRALQFLKQLGA